MKWKQQDDDEDGGGEDKAAEEQERGGGQADEARHRFASSVWSRRHCSHSGSSFYFTSWFFSVYYFPPFTLHFPFNFLFSFDLISPFYNCCNEHWNT